MDFIALDVETANASLASICQVGIVTFRGGQVVEQWQTLVNPEDYFDFINVAIHGITDDMVEDAPTFPQVAEVLRSTLKGHVVVSHMPFDQVALSRSAERYRIRNFECTWLDSARVARRAWEQYRYKGYGLATLANAFGISFQHHNAQEDARAAGEILLRAIADTETSLQEWLVRAYRPITSTSSTVARAGNPDGPLAGEVIVFTGALAMPRRQAADLAAALGCDVGDNVNKATTLLVVGDQDIRRLAGYDKSNKHRKAEELIGKGQPIRILGESDFLGLVGM